MKVGGVFEKLECFLLYQVEYEKSHDLLIRDSDCWSLISTQKQLCEMKCSDKLWITVMYDKPWTASVALYSGDRSCS